MSCKHIVKTLQVTEVSFTQRFKIIMAEKKIGSKHIVIPLSIIPKKVSGGLHNIFSKHIVVAKVSLEY